MIISQKNGGDEVLERETQVDYVPKRNGLPERLIGRSSRECLDQILVSRGASETDPLHLRGILQSSPHLALQKDAPINRAVQRFGRIIALLVLAGMHHQYIRI